MVKIVPHLQFDDNAKEAVEFYTSLIKGSKVNWLYTITDTPSGDCDLLEFEIAGKTIAAISGGPYFQLDESISFMLSCDSKEEVSRLTEAFFADGQVMMPLGEYPFNPHYAWVKDKYGMTWQLFTDDSLSQTYKLEYCLLFADKLVGLAKPALEYYGQLFNTPVLDVNEYQPGEAHDDRAKINYGKIVMEDTSIIAMDHGYTGDKVFSEAVSLMVYCDTQEEEDTYWEALNHVPAAAQCGWCKDQFGVSWQVVPSWLMTLYQSDNLEGIKAVNQAVLKMKKLDLAAMQAAFESVKD